jgi:Protein of unknown function (DUF4230)
METPVIHRILIGFGLAGLMLVAVSWVVTRSVNPSPETIASASLKGIREQNRLTAFVANYSAVVTSEQRRFGLSARKTLIMQGLVRYEVDMAKLASNDVRWDAETNTLRVRIPDIEVAAPQIDSGIWGRRYIDRTHRCRAGAGHRQP